MSGAQQKGTEAGEPQIRGEHQQYRSAEEGKCAETRGTFWAPPGNPAARRQCRKYLDETVKRYGNPNLQFAAPKILCQQR